MVTVFERNDAIGGLLQYGIPSMKLSRQVIQRRVDLMAKEGIAFKTGVNIGKDVAAKVSVCVQVDVTNPFLMCGGLALAGAFRRARRCGAVPRSDGPSRPVYSGPRFRWHPSGSVVLGDVAEESDQAEHQASVHSQR